MLEYKPPAQHFAYEIAALGNKKKNCLVIRGEKFKMVICLRERQKSANNCYWVGVLSLLKKNHIIQEYRK